MKRFDYHKAQTASDVTQMLQQALASTIPHPHTDPQAMRPVRLIAGGTNLLDLMKHQIEQPQVLIDVSRLPLDQVEVTAEGGLRIGARVSNSALAAHPLVRRDYPLLARALLAGASPQLRNKATTGGNLMQRTRCSYFYQPDSPCNKRVPGSGCPAHEGEHRMLAILGISEACRASHPSDMAVALMALGAWVELQDGRGQTRRCALADFYRLPGETPHLEHDLGTDELIVHVGLPAPVGGVQRYDKVRDRASYAFALVSLASVLRFENGLMAQVQVAFGGIGTRPWRDPELEQRLLGSAGTLADVSAATDLLLSTAQLDEQTQFKATLVRRLLSDAIRQARAQADLESRNAGSEALTAHSPVSVGVLS